MFLLNFQIFRIWVHSKTIKGHLIEFEQNLHFIGGPVFIFCIIIYCSICLQHHYTLFHIWTELHNTEFVAFNILLFYVISIKLTRLCDFTM